MAGYPNPKASRRTTASLLAFGILLLFRFHEVLLSRFALSFPLPLQIQWGQISNSTRSLHGIQLLLFALLKKIMQFNKKFGRV
jgi:hypothetical protein